MATASTTNHGECAYCGATTPGAATCDFHRALADSMVRGARRVTEQHHRDCPVDPGDEQSAVLRNALVDYGVDAPADACWCRLMDLVEITTAALGGADQ